jgi:hypothetical protein
MKLFKVTFDNNKPILARQVDYSNKVSAEIAYPNGKSILKWLILFAADEKESISSAGRIAQAIGFKC